MYKNKLSPKMKMFLLAGSPYWIGALVVSTGLMAIIEVLTPAIPLTYIWIYNIPIASFIPTMLLLCVGLAWLLHGFGFIIIKR